jgi:hypothetical protein
MASFDSQRFDKLGECLAHEWPQVKVHRDKLVLCIPAPIRSCPPSVSPLLPSVSHPLSVPLTTTYTLTLAQHTPSHSHSAHTLSLALTTHSHSAHTHSISLSTHTHSPHTLMLTHHTHSPLTTHSHPHSLTTYTLTLTHHTHSLSPHTLTLTHHTHSHTLTHTHSLIPTHHTHSPTDRTPSPTTHTLTLTHRTLSVTAYTFTPTHCTPSVTTHTHSPSVTTHTHTHSPHTFSPTTHSLITHTLTHHTHPLTSPHTRSLTTHSHSPHTLSLTLTHHRNLDVFLSFSEAHASGCFKDHKYDPNGLNLYFPEMCERTNAARDLTHYLRCFTEGCNEPGGGAYASVSVPGLHKESSGGSFRTAAIQEMSAGGVTLELQGHPSGPRCL